MKKRLLSLLLAIMLCVGLLPTTVLAANLVKSVDITMESPTAGMTIQEAKNLKLLTAKTGSTDLASGGSLSILKISSWDGEFDRTDPSNQKFKAGMTYVGYVQLAFANNYMANYDPATYCTDNSRFKVNVNGKAANVFQNTSAAYPTIQVTFTIAAPQPSAGEQAAAEAARLEKHDLRHATLRASATPYTVAQADALWWGENERDVVVLTQSGYNLSYLLKDISAQEQRFITKVIVDFVPKDTNNSILVGSHLGTDLPNIREVWLSDKTDVVQMVQGLINGVGWQPGGAYNWYTYNSTGFASARATLFIPASSLQAVKDEFTRSISLGTLAVPFNIRVYDGDVYTAQQKGASATRDWCTNHSYTMVLATADRTFTHGDCQTPHRWYYSCEYCNKCEYDPKHTYSDGKLGAHLFQDKLATEEAYVGVNAAGDHVFWYSCLNCGHSQNYFQKNVSKEEWRMSGTELTYEQYKVVAASDAANQANRALLATTSQPDMFTLSAKSAAKMSTWAQHGVNYALDNNLLDGALLGNDYTKPITRLQFCSVAVRLAEELTGKTIVPAPATTFSDTTNTYVLKAYAAGISSGTSTTTFSPNNTLDRQQMATFLYNTIQYVKANSSLRYSPYESKLSSYTDSGRIASWAVKPFAFMNALGLINGTSATTLAPTNKCTIEQALIVAYNSIYAHQVGWYQAYSPEEMSVGDSDYSYWYHPYSTIEVTATTIAPSDRVWVTGNRLGIALYDNNLELAAGKYSSNQSFYPTADPYTGQTHYIKAKTLCPIRE